MQIVFCVINKDKKAEQKAEAAKEMYTCPMPQDSVFSNKPGSCPKCGMNLVKMPQDIHEHEKVEEINEDIKKGRRKLSKQSLRFTQPILK